MEAIFWVIVERITWKMRLNYIALLKNGDINRATLLNYREKNETESLTLGDTERKNLTNNFGSGEIFLCVGGIMKPGCFSGQ